MRSIVLPFSSNSVSKKYLTIAKTALIGAAIISLGCNGEKKASVGINSPSIEPTPQSIQTPTPANINIEPPPPPAGNWQYIDQTSDGIILYIEAANSNGSTKQYWQRIEFPNGLTELTFTTADCSEGTHFFSWYEKYDGGGRKTAAGVPQQAGVKKNLIPGSIGGSAFEFMCKDWRN